MSTVTQSYSPSDAVASAAAGPDLVRPAEPPWGRLAAGGVAIVAAKGFYVVALAPDSKVPVPTVAYTGHAGPAGLVVTAVPLKAGAAKQSLTLDFTRRRTGAPYELLKTVSVRLLAPKGATAAAGGPKAPLKATMAMPGKWTVTLPAGQTVVAPGTWTLRVSASIKPGQAFKQTVPLAYK
jgi:hypothetical protein